MLLSLPLPYAEILSSALRSKSHSAFLFTDISERVLNVQRKADAVSPVELHAEVIHRLDAQWQCSDDCRQKPQNQDQQGGAAQGGLPPVEGSRHGRKTITGDQR